MSSTAYKTTRALIGLAIPSVAHSISARNTSSNPPSRIPVRSVPSQNKRPVVATPATKSTTTKGLRTHNSRSSATTTPPLSASTSKKQESSITKHVERLRASRAATSAKAPTRSTKRSNGQRAPQAQLASRSASSVLEHVSRIQKAREPRSSPQVSVRPSPSTSQSSSRKVSPTMPQGLQVRPTTLASELDLAQATSKLETIVTSSCARMVSPTLSLPSRSPSPAPSSLFLDDPIDQMLEELNALSLAPRPKSCLRQGSGTSLPKRVHWEFNRADGTNVHHVAPFVSGEAPLLATLDDVDLIRPVQHPHGTGDLSVRVPASEYKLCTGGLEVRRPHPDLGPKYTGNGPARCGCKTHEGRDCCPDCRATANQGCLEERSINGPQTAACSSCWSNPMRRQFFNAVIDIMMVHALDHVDTCLEESDEHRRNFQCGYVLTDMEEEVYHYRDTYGDRPVWHSRLVALNPEDDHLPSIPSE